MLDMTPLSNYQLHQQRLKLQPDRRIPPITDIPEGLQNVFVAISKNKNIQQIKLVKLDQVNWLITTYYNTTTQKEMETFLPNLLTTIPSSGYNKVIHETKLKSKLTHTELYLQPKN
jgi:hypothetical protein